MSGHDSCYPPRKLIDRLGRWLALPTGLTAIAISSTGLPGILAGIFTGALVGAVNGFLVTRIGIPSFLVTLGMQGVTTGAAMWITDTAPVPIANKTYVYFFGSGNFGPLPSLMFWTIAFLIVGHIVLRSTPFGRQIQAPAGNEIAARYRSSTNKKNQVLAFRGMSIVALCRMLYAGRCNPSGPMGARRRAPRSSRVCPGGTSMFAARHRHRHHRWPRAHRPDQYRADSEDARSQQMIGGGHHHPGCSPFWAQSSELIPSVPSQFWIQTQERTVVGSWVL